MTDFDEPTNPEARVLHPEVVRWCGDMVASARHSRQPAEVIADFERLFAMARGAGTEHVADGE